MSAPNYAVQDRSNVSVFRQLQPNVFEVVVLYPFGVEDAAVQSAAEQVAQLLSQPYLGQARAETPEPDDNSDRVATAAFVQLVQAAVLAQVRAMVADAVAGVLQTPGALGGLVPKTIPDTPDTAWLDHGVLTVTPSA